MEPMKTCLLLIPGMLNDASVWGDVVDALAPDAHTEVRFAAVAGGGGIDDMAREAWAALADLDPATRLVVCGFSMGGYVAIEMATLPARRIDALVLLDTSGRPDSVEGREARVRTIAALEADFERSVEGILAFGTDKASRGDAALMARMRAMMLGVGAATAIAQTRAIAARADRRPALSALATPTIVACGSSDRITPPERSQELAQLIPGAALQWIEHAGHMTPLEQPRAVAAVIRPTLACDPTGKSAG